MKRHLKNSEVIRFIVDRSESRQFKSEQNHIDKCDKCKKKYDTIKSIMKNPDINGIRPSDDVIKRIFSSYDNIREEEEKKIIK